MGSFIIFNGCIYLLPAFFLCVNSESTYGEYFIESDKICTLGFRPRVIEIGKDAKSGAIVEELSYFRSLTGKYPYRCKFIVESNFKMGIFAVIQRMVLRKNQTTGECVDYVQFRHANSFQVGPVELNWHSDKDDRSWGEKHCGEVNAKEIDFSSLSPAEPAKPLRYAFIDRKGKVDVRIYIANQTIDHRKELDLKIAFTAFHICQFDMGSQYKKCGADACIWKDFFHDDILNCPFTTCADEGGCQIYYETAGVRTSAGLATKIMVGAVAGVFTMFIVFVMFLWLFRHCALCWNSPTPSAQNTTQMRPVPTMEEVQPTAPPGTPSIDKDLPPSYESLFPNP